MKKITYLAVTAFLIINNMLHAQISFQKNYAFQAAIPGFNSVNQTADGGYILAGGSRSTNNHDGVFLMKINALGDTSWTKSYGATAGTQNSQRAKAVVQTYDGGYFAAGFSEAFSTNFNFCLIRTNSSGDTLWTRSLSHPSGAHDYCYSALQTNDSNLITFGRQGLFEVDFYLNKWNQSGNIIWSKYYSIPGNFDFGNSVYQTSDHGYIMAGTTEVGNVSDVLIVKVDSAGIFQWAKTYGGSSPDECNVIRQTNDGGYVIAGTTQSFGAGFTDIFIIKTNASGDTLWTKTFGTSNAEECSSVKQTADHGYILTGSAYSSTAFSYQLPLIRLDAAGNMMWSKNYGVNSFGAEGYDVIQANDGGFLACGEASFTTDGGYVVKTDALGNSGCNEITANFTVGHAPFQVTSVTVSGGSNSLVGYPPNVAGGGATVETLCISNRINEIANDNPIQIFPNPVSSASAFTISCPQILKTGEIKINNITGETIFHERIFKDSEIKINLRDIAPGIYFVTLNVQEKHFSNKLIIY